ncbi:MAG: hypothetical protein HQ568_03465 [Calditrichaeota bacterium]|nr:hypothetical protein [Calditrichota bacterium]
MNTLDRLNVSDREVRLFPSVHIKSNREAELRATASFLAMVRAVSEFGREVIAESGGKAGKLGKIHCFTEVSIDDGTPDNSKWPRPDGIIYYQRGKYKWKALVEVKVGDNHLDENQINTYIKLAREKRFDAVLTISSQPAVQNGGPPLKKLKKYKGVNVVHFSWERLVSIAQVLASKELVQDNDQQWMLNEWIRYFVDPESRIINPPDLGKNWNDVLKAASTRNMHTCVSKLDDVVNHWIGFLRIAGLRLSAKLGLDVIPRITSKERNNPQSRIDRIKKKFIDDSILLGEIKVPRTVNYIQLVLDAAKKEITYRIEVNPRSEGKQTTRVNWLLKQLRVSDHIPDGLLFKVKWNKQKLMSWDEFKRIQNNEKLLYFTKDNVPIPKDAMPSNFILELNRSFRQGHGRSGAKDLENILKSLEYFYQNVVVLLKSYEAKPKNLPLIQTDEENNDVINEEVKS